MVNESDFFNVLKNMANSLRSIDENLKNINISKKRETDQFIKESKQRMEKRRIQLNETKNHYCHKEKTTINETK